MRRKVAHTVTIRVEVKLVKNCRNVCILFKSQFPYLRNYLFGKNISKEPTVCLSLNRILITTAYRILYAI